MKLIIIIFVVLLTSACQPTPDRNIVQNKNELEDLVTVNRTNQAEVISESANNSWITDENILYEESRDIESEYQTYTVTCTIDSKIPEVSFGVPVILIEPSDFSLDFASTAANYLLEDDIYQNKRTKDDIILEKIHFEKSISSLDHNNTTVQNLIEGFEEWNETMLASAPTVNSIAEIKYLNEYNNGDQVALKSYLPNSRIGEMLITNNGNLTFMRYHSNDMDNFFEVGKKLDTESEKLNGCELSYNEALDISDRLVDQVYSKVCANGMTLQQVKIFNNKNRYQLMAGMYSDNNENSNQQGYVFIYKPSYDTQIPALVIEGATTFEPEGSRVYREPYAQECAVVLVDDYGIVMSFYYSPSKIVNIVNDNVEIISFNEALDLFKDKVFYQYLWSSGYDININIKNIEFGLIRIPVEDNLNQYMMIPAYNFIGDIIHENIDYPEVESNKSIMLINALDGSVVMDINDEIVIK